MGQPPRAGEQVLLVSHHRALRQQDRLRCARAARGEQHQSGVVFVDRHCRRGSGRTGVRGEVSGECADSQGRHRVRCRQLAVAGVVGQQEHWLGQGESVLDLGIAPPSVGHHGHSTDRPDCPHGQHELGAVICPQHHVVAGADAALTHHRAGTVKGAAELLEGDPLLGIDDECPLVPSLGTEKHVGDLLRPLAVDQPAMPGALTRFDVGSPQRGQGVELCGRGSLGVHRPLHSPSPHSWNARTTEPSLCTTSASQTPNRPTFRAADGMAHPGITGLRRTRRNRLRPE